MREDRRISLDHERQKITDKMEERERDHREEELKDSDSTHMIDEGLWPDILSRNCTEHTHCCDPFHSVVLVSTTFLNGEVLVIERSWMAAMSLFSSSVGANISTWKNNKTAVHLTFIYADAVVPRLKAIHESTCRGTYQPTLCGSAFSDAMEFAGSCSVCQRRWFNLNLTSCTLTSVKEMQAK